jgi:hypothetical protein
MKLPTVPCLSAARALKEAEFASCAVTVRAKNDDKERNLCAVHVIALPRGETSTS